MLGVGFQLHCSARRGTMSQGRFYLNFKQMDTEYYLLTNVYQPFKLHVVDVRFFFSFKYKDGQSLNKMLFLIFLIRIRTQIIS